MRSNTLESDNHTGNLLTLALDRPAQVDRSAFRDAPRVLIVDDHRTFAELLAGALAASGMDVLGTAHSAAQAIAMAQELQPDVVVMDIEMPREDGLSATRRLREVAPHTAVAVVTAHRDPEWVVRAGHAGASAFIPKDGSLTEMIDVLTRVRAGQMLVAPSTFAATPTAGSRPQPADRGPPAADPPRAGGAQLPRARDAGQGHRPGAGHQRGDLPRLREEPARQARRRLPARGGREGPAARTAGRRPTE